MLTTERTTQVSRIKNSGKAFLFIFVAIALGGCAVGPATRADYENIYRQKCLGGDFDRPTYCDRRLDCFAEDSDLI